ncbi:phosphodiester glycosidase family protein [Thermosipho ferrireducens]|uniref:Phosphodiester glycosidase family protein n=1 Tax=Thermosipho ferrireducens TaxID=2571116 RepID=A0ABX7S8J0_9BACT|nr:phosphodiester glycosidase family protein [Thermosipho ferrireducens]QTA37425.1 phosphodiester glycosidase family protein [Thermosipho ferrireducens]
MKKIIVIFLSFSLISILFSTTILINGQAFQTTTEWLPSKLINTLGFRYVLNEKVYMVYKNDLFIGKEGTFTLNFEQKFENAFKIENDKLYINVLFLKNYFGLYEYRLENGTKIFYDHLPELKNIQFKDNTLNLVFSKEITKEIVNVEIIDRDLYINIEPCIGNPTVNGNVSVQKQAKGFLISITNNRLKPIPIITIQKNVMRITLNFTEEESKKIKEGILWERKIETFNNNKYLVNYLHIDPKKVEITPIISSKGIGTRDDLRNILKDNNCIAGINGNYFDPATNLPIDLVIINGKILSDKFSLRPVFIITYSNDVFIKRITLELNVYIGDLLFLVKGVNTTAKGEVLVYTSEFSLKIPLSEDKIYYVVKNGKIISENYVEKVPENSVVISIDKKYEKYLTNIKIGTKVDFVSNTDFPLPIKHAIGGGPLLIENGKEIIDSEEEKMRYGNGLALSKTSRTILAITKDGKVDFIVIEGYNNKSGMDYDIATKFLLEKGYYSAMMLDGGGSSAMVINNEVVNQDGEIQRGIPVGLGVK